eukprot:CAMPEP_0198303758 /NCGR_PEP_ID=MMETSP1449-20131203/57056_1 /TAXON_ID=420275 /ORGANISM="Attheya septentrionalis, Strain CCMP2084" /LENGTH=205 /DNA_ID=CAMNT_0044006265 /DNA_START=356 /DNA_END=973 /DNA_ORIENTATION=-
MIASHEMWLLLGGMTARIEQASKIDPITAVQDTIDSLSLSLFESLRGLRDAVAPESVITAGTGGAGAALEQDPDYEDFLIAYSNGDAKAKALVANAAGSLPKTREEYFKMKAKSEMLEDTKLVTRVAQQILAKTEAVDELVEKLPGMDRTKAQQMERIQQLLDQNHAVSKELESAYEEAERKRNEVRTKLGEVTCDAIGIIEEET